MPEGFGHGGQTQLDVKQHAAAREMARQKGIRFSEALRRVRQAQNA